MTFGEKLREARKAAGLSQEQFAEKMSVSRSAVAKWESDKGLPDVNNLKVMAQLLGVTIDYLLDDEEKLNLSETKEPIDLIPLRRQVRPEIRRMQWYWPSSRMRMLSILL